MHRLDTAKQTTNWQHWKSCRLHHTPHASRNYFAISSTETEKEYNATSFELLLCYEKRKADNFCSADR
ncbi:hypothetical protein V1264_011186 [Littorina saxatilis]|uniref:Uncharacterized protein n=1 Tax=Littorina saxatilis TaxID=31220 RepID=A0AAN9BTM3_9CAEN